jgi:glycosyltransferase involved in cell wall biosynthesis
MNLLLGLSFRESELEFVVFANNPLPRKIIDRSGGPFRGRFQWVNTLSQPGSLVERAEIPWLLRLHRVKLFHNTATSAVWTGKVPSVVTVHEFAARHFDPAAFRMKRLKRLFRTARFVISVSNALAGEVEDLFHISRPKIRVIANAIDPWYTERVSENEIRAMRDHFRLPEKYFLSVTAERPNKNIALLRTLAEKWPGTKWVLTTSGAETTSLRYLEEVEDAWLRPLYAASEAVVVPSLYEGFSLPPLEALAAGAVPVVSDIAPHREVLGEILPRELFFDPKQANALESALRAAADGGPSLKNAIFEKFRSARDRYSFVETAAQVHAVYKDCL